MSIKSKHNIEYIGKVEKAISDKYGQEAVVNPRSLWDEEKEKEYKEQVRENAEKYYKKDEDSDVIENNGIFISKKLLNKRNSSSCDVCNKYMLDIRDKVFMAKWECCHECYVKWVEDREERWLSGWKPKKE